MYRRTSRCAPWSGRVLLLGLVTAAAGSAGARTAKPDELAGKAATVLRTYCYVCHGRNGRNEGGFNTVTDLSRLVEARKVRPGQPDASPLLRRILDGSMPPELDDADESDQPPALPRPGPAELDILRAWIAAGAPDDAPPAVDRPFVGDLEVLTAIRNDLRAGDPRDRRYFRYFTITHLYNAGYSEEQLQTYRLGLAKLVNSLSWGRHIRLPFAIDAKRTVLRIDLRDYLWDEALWNTITSRYPYGLHYEGMTTKDVTQMTGCRLPAVRADWFVFAASRPPLYHDVLRIPESLAILEEKVNVASLTNFRQERVTRSGFANSGVSSNNRVIERHDSSYGAYWRSYDFNGNGLRKNIFAKPLGPGSGAEDFAFAHDGGEIIFDLPNGLHGYMLTNAFGERLERAPTEIVRDPKQSDGAVVNGISCMSCHARGLIPKADEVREVVSRSRSFPPADAETILVIYPPQERLKLLLREDNERFAAAVKATGTARGRTDPVYALARQFEDELDLTLAAAESGVRPDEFKNLMARSPSLGQAMGPLLVGGRVKRDAFVAAFALIAEARRIEFLPPSSLPPNRPASVDGVHAPIGMSGATDRWIVVFRGRDPGRWNTASGGSTFAVLLAAVPADIAFVRLKRLDTGDALIVPTTRDGLGRTVSAASTPTLWAWWCGSKAEFNDALHVGIAEGPLLRHDDPAMRRKFVVQPELADGFTGSGFGHVANSGGWRQAYGWRGEIIAPTDFEIAVVRGPLFDEEKTLLFEAGRSPRGTARVLLPSAFGGSDRDGFRDDAPEGGILVGLRVRFTDGDRPTIGSIKAIYRVGTRNHEGAWIGDRGIGPEFQCLARAGYVVGAIATPHGSPLNGFALKFVRLAAEGINLRDSYASPWIGPSPPGSTETRDSEGRQVVGIHGVCRGTVEALGLVLRP